MNAFRVICLYDAAGALEAAAQAAELSVVYAHQSGGNTSIPPFDLLCAILPNGSQGDNFSSVIRLLRTHHPKAFLLVVEYVGGLTRHIINRTRQAGYQINAHIVGEQTLIVGALDDAGSAELALWQIAEIAIPPRQN